jgi:hypothetical protein
MLRVSKMEELELFAQFLGGGGWSCTFASTSLQFRNNSPSEQLSPKRARFGAMSVFGQHLPPPLNLVYPAIHRAESNPFSQRQKHLSSIVATCIEPSDDLMLVQVKIILKTILKAMTSTIFAMIWCKQRAGTS